MENRRPKPDQELAEREIEATDDETLEDLEESFGASDEEETDSGNIPSPDGQYDESDELNQADPT